MQNNHLLIRSNQFSDDFQHYQHQDKNITLNIVNVRSLNIVHVFDSFFLLSFSLLHLDLYKKILGRRLDPWKQGFAQVQETVAVSQL